MNFLDHNSILQLQKSKTLFNLLKFEENMMNLGTIKTQIELERMNINNDGFSLDDFLTNGDFTVDEIKTVLKVAIAIDHGADHTQFAQLADGFEKYLEDSDDDTDDDVNLDNVPEVIKAAIKYAMINGYLSQTDDCGRRVKYGVSKENIREVVDDNEVDDRTLAALILSFENSGIKFKFLTNAEWMINGYIDPVND